MGSLSEWRRGPVLALAFAWIAGVGAMLTLWLLAYVRGLERSFEDIGYSLGATSVEFHVDVRSALPELAAMYLAIVVLPPTVLVWRWRRARARMNGRIEEQEAAL
jgi:hypothetical protein